MFFGGKVAEGKMRALMYYQRILKSVAFFPGSDFAMKLMLE